MKGLYLITNDDPLSLLLKKIEAAFITGKVALLQYRRKHIAQSYQPYEIEKILTLCQLYRIPFIINDNIHLAQQFGVGVHLGQSDGKIQHAKTLLGLNAVIGRTCHNSLDLAKQAVDDGASYIAFGAIYPSNSKNTQVTHIGMQVIEQARQQFPDIPICAIGGLTVNNASQVILAGADLCAVIHDIFHLESDEEIVQRVNLWGNLFVNHDSKSIKL